MNMRVMFSGLFVRRALTVVLLMSAAIEAGSQVLPAAPTTPNRPTLPPTVLQPSAPAVGAAIALFASRSPNVSLAPGTGWTNVAPLALPPNSKFVLTATAQVGVIGGTVSCELLSANQVTLSSIAAFSQGGPYAMAPLTLVGFDAVGAAGDQIALACNTNGTQTVVYSATISAVSVSSINTE